MSSSPKPTEEGDAEGIRRLDIEAMGRRARERAMHGAIPVELRALPWVLWRFMPPRTPGAKPGKRPLQRSGEPASSTDAGTWCSFEEARAVFDRSKRFHGIGVILAGQGIACVDLDKCRDDVTGALEPWAAEDVRRLASWCEVSPSGTGVHIFIRAKLPPGWRKTKDGRREVYETERFIAMTGLPALDDVANVGERQAELDAWHREHAPPVAPPSPPPAPRRPAPVVRSTPPTPAPTPSKEVPLRSFVAEVLEVLRLRNLDCVSLAARLGLRQKPGSNARRWFCPACQTDESKTPDLHTPKLSDKAGGWKCHKCNRKGGPFELVALVRGFNVKGAGFVAAARELARLEGLEAELEGEKELSEDARKSEHPEIRESRLAPGALIAAWGAMRGGAAGAWLEEQRGIPPRLVESGFGTIDKATAEGLPWPLDTDGHPYREHAVRTVSRRPCIAAPLRSAATNDVEAIHVRELEGPSPYRGTISKKRDEDGTPRGYGWAGAALRAELLLLTEGMADTFATEAALLDDVGAVVVGAIDKGELETWARWLASRVSADARVVLLRQLDGKAPGELGGGQLEAKKAHSILSAAGRRVEHFSWGKFARELFARGLDIGPRRAFALDVADVARLACHVSPDGFRVTFRPALRAALGLPLEEPVPPPVDDAWANYLAAGGPESTAALIDELWGKA